MTIHTGPPRTAPINRGRDYTACLHGLEPAEILEPRARECLVFELWGSGWSDVEIATWTRLTTFTTARIRVRLGLAAHPSTKGEAA